MPDENKGQAATAVLAELAGLIGRLSDSEFSEIFSVGSLLALLDSILDPTEARKYPTLAEFFLAKKTRLTVLAQFRHLITLRYSYLGSNTKGEKAYVSPLLFQWFDDGVMLLEGPKPFEGSISLYRNKRQSFAIASRDVRANEAVGPEHVTFIDLDDIPKYTAEIPAEDISNLDEPLLALKHLIDAKANDESKYQEILIKYPWVLGAQYRKINRHEKLDDRNIPDFTGVRVHDDNRDIIEVKPPFMKTFLENGDFSSEFNDAWNQAERYLDFAQQDKDYLYRSKGLRFDNPICILILGINLTDDQIKKIRVKQRNTRSIHLYTYNDLLVYAQATIDFVKRLRRLEKTTEAPTDKTES